MKINNKLIIYKTLQAYEDAYQGEKIKDDSIVFVIEDHTIRTHGKVFGDGANHQKGFFESVDKLPENALDGDLAIVYEDGKWYVYIYHSSTGWVKGNEYQMPNLTTDILNQYIKKTNIRDYLKDIYNNVYVRKDEVYEPDQEWTVDYSGNSWKWDEEGNLYLIDKELDVNSTNAVENRVVTRELSSKVDINNYRNDKQNTSDQIANVSNRVVNVSNKITDILNKISIIENVLDTKLNIRDIYTPEQGEFNPTEWPEVEPDEPWNPDSTTPTPGSSVDITPAQIEEYINGLPKMQIISKDTYESMTEFDSNTSYWIYE